MPENIPYILIVALVSLIIGWSKGGLGAVLASMGIPLLTLVMSVPTAISTVLPLLMIGDMFALWAFWKKWDWSYLRPLIIPTMIGILIGTYFLAVLPDEILRRLLAVFILIFIAYRLFFKNIESDNYQRRWWHSYLAGITSGIGSAVANAGAPPLTIFLLLQKIPPVAFVGTTAIYFAMVNALKLPPLIAANLFHINDLWSVAWAIPFIPLGVWTGRIIVNRVSPLTFERIMLATLFISSLILLFIPSPK